MRGTVILLGAKPTEPDPDLGYLAIGDRLTELPEVRRLAAFVEKPPPEEAPTNRINAGVYVLEPSVLDHIDGGRRVSIERETFPALITAGGLFALDDGGAYWRELGGFPAGRLYRRDNHYTGRVQWRFSGSR